jgi:hypothetical protein
MSIQVIQFFKEQEVRINKKGKKIVIMGFENVKQYWFQEEVWELIKEFIITPRSILLLNMKKLGIPRLCDIFKGYFRRRITNMKSSAIPLEQRRKLITKAIIDKCQAEPTKYAVIMENEFQVKPKPVKNHDWLKDFEVGEEVVVAHFKSKKPRTVTQNRKGIIRKIGKTIQVELYDYYRIDCGAWKTQSYGYDRLKWLNTFDEKVIVYNRYSIYKRGENSFTDRYFEEGSKSVDYGW